MEELNLINEDKMQLKYFLNQNQKTVSNVFFKNESEWDNSTGLLEKQKKEWKHSDHAYLEQWHKDCSFWDKTNLPKNVTFFHPVKFLSLMEKVATPAAFNPYKGKPSVTIDVTDFINQKRTQDFKDSPGFAPYNTDLSKNGYEYDNLKYAYITCLFDVKRGSSNARHTGVDFGSWQKSVPIKSFISGKVLACTWNKTKKEKAGEGYGNMMLIEGNNGYLYLLAHLTSFLKKEGESILPGSDVAMSGQTGYSDGYHLHLEIIKPLNSKTKLDSVKICSQFL